MAAISGKRATDERVTCLRIFADANGETHMEDVELPYSQNNFSKITLLYGSRTISQLLGTTSVTYPPACTRWIGTIRLSACLFSG